MKMFLTKGMFGERIEQIGSEFDTFQDAMNCLSEWKSSKTNKKLYKIEKYYRVISDKSRCETAVDFGDYTYFIVIEKNEKKEGTNENEEK